MNSNTYSREEKSFLSSAGDSWNRKPGRLCEYREPTLHPSAQGVFRKPQLIFVFQGHNVTPHTFILVEECGMDIESAFPPHAVDPIFTRYEHNGHCVGLNNENIKCGSSATIEQLKQRVEQYCYKSAPRAMRRLYQEMPQHIRRLRRMRGYLPNNNPWYQMNELTPEFH